MDMQALKSLFEGNRRHVETMRARHDDRIEEWQAGQDPAYVTVCCSDSRVSNEATFDHVEPGTNFTIGAIGNKVVGFDVDGGRQISGDVSYIPANQNPEALVVMGHTGCGAITAVYDHATGEGIETQPPGVRDIVEQLLYPELADHVDTLPGNRDLAVAHLVEYNVDRQIAHLAEGDEIPSSLPLIGLVYDLHEYYGSEPGAIHLVNLDGCTDYDELADALPEEFRPRARRLTTSFDDGG
jgi:carbonic anhydrase